MIGVKFKEHYAKEVKVRQGARTDIKEKLPECYDREPKQATDEVAEQFQVSGRTVFSNFKILKT